MFKCQECGRKFKTVKSAQRASNNGCPKCGGVDIDIDTDAYRCPECGGSERYSDSDCRNCGSIVRGRSRE
jgi:DNA-directed RNA polymerase subunit RPC12/RpoP